MSPATSGAKADPMSKLRLHYDVAMRAGDHFMDFITRIAVVDIYVFWPRRMDSLQRTGR